MWMEGSGMSPAEAFDWTAFALCMLFAWIMQVDANFVNDYFDFRKGGDTEQRLGPKRACAQGWITPRAMKTGILVTTVLACAAGLPLIWTGGPWMIAVGALCVLFCFLYTTKFSRLGLGDVLVLVFFGIVPVGFTFYLQTGTWDLQTTLAGLACGLAVDCLLMVNNYRDRAEDATQGKKTIVVRLGGSTAIILYYLLGLCATMLAAAEQARMVRRSPAAVRRPAPGHIPAHQRYRRSSPEPLPGQDFPQFFPYGADVRRGMRSLKRGNYFCIKVQFLQ